MKQSLFLLVFLGAWFFSSAVSPVFGQPITPLDFSGSPVCPNTFGFFPNVANGVDATVTVVQTVGAVSGTVSNMGGGMMNNDLRFGLYGPGPSNMDVGPTPNTSPAVLFRMNFFRAGTNTPIVLPKVELRFLGMDAQSFVEQVSTTNFCSVQLSNNTNYIQVPNGAPFILSPGPGTTTLLATIDAAPDAFFISYANVSEILIEYGLTGSSAMAICCPRGMDIDGNQEIPLDPLNVPALPPWAIGLAIMSFCGCGIYFGRR